MKWLFVLISIFSGNLISQAEALCSCTPLVYKWRLDFDLTCPPANVSFGLNAGMMDVFCQIDSEANTTDLTPVSVQSYQIIELSQGLTPIKVNNRSDLNLTNGNIITFNSMTTVQPEIISE